MFNLLLIRLGIADCGFMKRAADFQSAIRNRITHIATQPEGLLATLFWRANNSPAPPLRSSIRRPMKSLAGQSAPGRRVGSKRAGSPSTPRPTRPEHQAPPATLTHVKPF